VRNRIFESIRRLISLRKGEPSLAGMQMELIPTDCPPVLGYPRQHDGNRLVVLANFSETLCQIPGNRPRITGLVRFFKDLCTDETIGTATEVSLGPYQFMWLTRV
jgi:amylosucrase